jgi:UDP-N-acetylglucosamine--N-acetylmuramyl-(pentapeptide) pyrophosphoryl-undecaprenol N-acetylglucosamine transferase
MIVQQELTPERLAQELRRLIDDPEEIDRMEEASRKLGRPDSAKRAVDLAMSIVEVRSQESGVRS